MMKLVVAVALLIGLITWRVVRKKKAREAAALHRAQPHVIRDEEADDAVDALSDEALSTNARLREDGVAPAIPTATTGRAGTTNSPTTTPAAKKKKKGGVLKGAAQLAMQGVKAVVPPYIIIDSGPRGY